MLGLEHHSEAHPLASPRRKPGSSLFLSRLRRELDTGFRRYDAEKLIPVFPGPIILPSPRPTKGAFARRCRSGTGRGARGARFAASHPGGTGAPPGSNTRPCQELADDLPACVSKRADRKARPGGIAQKSPRNEHAPSWQQVRGVCLRCAAASLQMRVWRAGRRLPYPATDTDTKGLRFSARRPLRPRAARGRASSRASRSFRAARSLGAPLLLDRPNQP
jgi:hypothetical protein